MSLAAVCTHLQALNLLPQVVSVAQLVSLAKAIVGQPVRSVPSPLHCCCWCSALSPSRVRDVE